MATATLDVVGIGNAIVDVIAHADETFLATHGLAKGAMTLIDAARADALYAVMGPGVEMSGGSAGNTMAGIASLGGTGAYIGKVRNDQLGQVFRHDITASGVRFTTTPATRRAGHRALPHPGDARCAAHHEHLPRRLRRARPGRDRPRADRRGAGDLSRGLSLRPAARQGSLSQGGEDRPSVRPPRRAQPVRCFCVDRHRAEFRALLADHVDIVFANEAELCSMFETADFDAAWPRSASSAMSPR